MIVPKAGAPSVLLHPRVGLKWRHAPEGRHGPGSVHQFFTRRLPALPGV